MKIIYMGLFGKHLNTFVKRCESVANAHLQGQIGSQLFITIPGIYINAVFPLFLEGMVCTFRWTEYWKLNFCLHTMSSEDTVKESTVKSSRHLGGRERTPRYGTKSNFNVAVRRFRNHNVGIRPCLPWAASANQSCSIAASFWWVKTFLGFRGFSSATEL